MECWAHAAARRRQLSNETSFVSPSSSSASSRKSSSITSASPASSVSLELPIFSDMIRRSLPQGRLPHVCVIGAGMAGLKAADVLTKKGVRVTILEGRDRIGGRVGATNLEAELEGLNEEQIHQSTHLGHLADLGPNWIHGTEGNPILDLANETNTACFEPPIDVPTWLYDEKGMFVDSHVSQEQTGMVWETIESAYKYSRDSTGSISSERSLLDFFKMQFEEKKIDQAAAKQMLQIARVWGDVVGEPIERQSLKFFWLEECLEGENLFLAGTYKAILDIVSQSALAGVDLQLNTVVQAITTATNHDGSLSVILTTTDGRNTTFDQVILTTPLGWLKKNLAAFSPPLPKRVTTAIGNISYGRLEKVYITFPTAWWLTPSAPKPFFTQFLSPQYSTETNPEKWSIECTCLASLPESTAHPTLLFYINGPCAQHVTSLAHGLTPGTPEHMAKLIPFFYPYFSLLPHHTTSDPNCKPKAVLATNWIGDDLAGNGSYSNFQISKPEEGVELDKDIEALREGVPEKGVWFAGEATAPFVALGTVTGAYWSGEAVGHRILSVYGLEEEGKGDEMMNEKEELGGGEPKSMNGAA